jgi:hypothetical protein
LGEVQLLLPAGSTDDSRPSTVRQLDKEASEPTTRTEDEHPFFRSEVGLVNETDGGSPVVE